MSISNRQSLHRLTRGSLTVSVALAVGCGQSSPGSEYGPGPKDAADEDAADGGQADGNNLGDVADLDGETDAVGADATGGPHPGPCTMKIVPAGASTPKLHALLVYDTFGQVVREELAFDGASSPEQIYENEYEDAPGGRYVLPCVPAGSASHVRLPLESYWAEWGDEPPVEVLSESCEHRGLIHAVDAERRLTRQTLITAEPSTGQDSRFIKTYSYDAEGRLVGIEASFDPVPPNWAGPNPFAWGTYAYDGQGRLTSNQERSTTIGHADGTSSPGLNRTAYTYSGSTVKLSSDHDYDTTTFSEELLLDAAGRISERRFGDSVASVTWNANGDWTRYETAWASGSLAISELDLQYDAQGRVDVVVLRSGNAPVNVERSARWTYTRNARGNVEEIELESWVLDASDPSAGQWVGVYTIGYTFECW